MCVYRIYFIHQLLTYVLMKSVSPVLKNDFAQDRTGDVLRVKQMP